MFFFPQDTDESGSQHDSKWTSYDEDLSSDDNTETKKVVAPVKNVNMVKVKPEQPTKIEDLKRPLKRLELLIGSVGPGRKGICSLKGFMSSCLWMISLGIHFTYDFYESITVFGHTFAATQAIWLLAFFVCSIATSVRCYPWLRTGLFELKGCGCYNKSLKSVAKSIMVSLSFLLIV